MRRPSAASHWSSPGTRHGGENRGALRVATFSACLGSRDRRPPGSTFEARAVCFVNRGLGTTGPPLRVGVPRNSGVHVAPHWCHPSRRSLRARLRCGDGPCRHSCSRRSALAARRIVREELDFCPRGDRRACRCSMRRSQAPAEFVTPAVFRYHPHDAAPMTARAVLPAGPSCSQGSGASAGSCRPAQGRRRAPPKCRRRNSSSFSERITGSSSWGGAARATNRDIPSGLFCARERHSSLSCESARRAPCSSECVATARSSRSDDGGAAWARVGPDGVRFPRHRSPFRRQRARAGAAPSGSSKRTTSERRSPGARCRAREPRSSSWTRTQASSSRERQTTLDHDGAIPRAERSVPPSAPLSARAQ